MSIKGLLLTMLLCAFFPLLLSYLQTEKTTKVRFFVECFALNLAVVFFFILISWYDGVERSNGMPYFLWTTVFSGVGAAIVSQKGLLEDPSEKNTEKLKEQYPVRFVFVCKKCGFKSIGMIKECPECRAVDSFCKAKIENGEAVILPRTETKTMLGIRAEGSASSQNKRALYCGNCGAKLPEGQIMFCPNCGNKILN